MARVLVTGATGLLGCALAPFLTARGHSVTSHGFGGSADLRADLTQYPQTLEMLAQAKPEIVVHLAALTNVDMCEATPDLAYRLNVLTVQNLCRGVRQCESNCHLVHISSDMVYDGLGPHAEDDISVVNTYGLSKIAGELAALTVAGTVLRTNFFGRSRCPGRASLTDWLHQSLLSGTPIQVFDDVLFSPLSLPTLCAQIDLVIQRRPIGLFNLGARDGMSKGDFAFAFAAALGLPTRNMRRGTSAGMSMLQAKRPTDMRMDCGKFEGMMKLELPRLIDEIHLIRNDYHEST